jgi:threonine dehydrogenase-like Zn-dependent dehydrogenase
VDRVRAVVADITPARYLATAAAGHLPGGARFGWSRGGMLGLQEQHPAPALPDADGWVRLRPELSGICGSDLGVATAKASLALSAFYSAPRQILGHEIVAVVDEVGRGVTRFAPGDRVAVDPVVSCLQRGFNPVCRSCAEGMPYVCERFDQPGVAGCVAPTIGFDAVLGGGWGELIVAHESQLHAVGGIPSRRAVLAEPASIGLHAALHWERRGDRVVVIGPGTIGLLTTAALRMLHPDLDIIVLSPGGSADARALAAGATRVFPSGPGAVELLATSDGGRVLRPRLTRTPILEHGVDAVFDCVARPETLDLAMHLLRPTGMLVLVGAATKQEVDWSLVWARQLTVQGTINFGPEPALDGRHTMSQVVEWLADAAFPADLVTHVFLLDDWRQALDTAAAGPRVGAVKVTLRPNPGIPLVGEPATSPTAS